MNAEDLDGTGAYFIGVRLLLTVNKYKALYGKDPVRKYSLRMWEAKCKLWNDELGAYSSKGCKVNLTFPAGKIAKKQV